MLQAKNLAVGLIISFISNAMTEKCLFKIYEVFVINIKFVLGCHNNLQLVCLIRYNFIERFMIINSMWLRGYSDLLPMSFSIKYFKVLNIQKHLLTIIRSFYKIHARLCIFDHKTIVELISNFNGLSNYWCCS